MRYSTSSTSPSASDRARAVVLRHGLPVVGVKDAGEHLAAHREDLLRRVAEHVEHLPVGEHVALFDDVEDVDEVRRDAEDVLEERLALLELALGALGRRGVDHHAADELDAALRVGEREHAQHRVARGLRGARGSRRRSRARAASRRSRRPPAAPARCASATRGTTSRTVLPDVLVRGPAVQRGEGLVDADVAQVAVEDEEPDRRTAEEARDDLLRLAPLGDVEDEGANCPCRGDTT